MTTEALEFLEKCGLGNYGPSFMKHGYDRLETFKVMSADEWEKALDKDEINMFSCFYIITWMDGLFPYFVVFLFLALQVMCFTYFLCLHLYFVSLALL